MLVKTKSFGATDGLGRSIIEDLEDVSATAAKSPCRVCEFQGSSPQRNQGRASGLSKASGRPPQPHDLGGADRVPTAMTPRKYHISVGFSRHFLCGCDYGPVKWQTVGPAGRWPGKVEGVAQMATYRLLEVRVTDPQNCYSRLLTYLKEVALRHSALKTRGLHRRGTIAGKASLYRR